ncbi:hypothetical protein UFOVP129_21 [uncultured Caudovirales phage]|uniref:Uncharacterized protein n=1 Tax=uncultured Caudovirales phage TaxID=2100421 RepID=A0A6J5LB80_9CAUD|nr:hypothetical protein UFOVP129_21 [uncultured Caudovirales phage]
MKRLTILFLFISSFAFSQSWTPIAGKQRFTNGLGVPAKDTATTSSADTSMITIRPQDSTLWFKYKGSWRSAGSVGGGSTGTVTGTGVSQRFAWWNGTNSQTYSNNFTLDSTLGQAYLYKLQTTGINYKPLSTVPTSPTVGYSTYSRTNNGITQLYGLDSLGKESRLTPVGASAKNTTGSTISQFIPVCLDSSASVAVAKGSYQKFFPFAVTQDAIANNGYGRIVYNGGTVTGMSLGAYQNGATLYLADGGGLSTTPSTIYPAVRIGIVTSNTLGNMLVAIANVPKDSLNAATYVPYTGANGNVDLGTHTLISNSVQAKSYDLYDNTVGMYSHQILDNGEYSTTLPGYSGYKFNFQNLGAVRTYIYPDRNITLDNITTSTTTAINGLLKGNGSVISAATSGASNDYLVGASLSATRNVSTGSIFTYNSATGAYNLDSSALSLNSDVIPLASFGAGSAAAGDTSAFSTTAVYGSFYNSGTDTLIITKIQAGVQGTSASVLATVWVNDSLLVETTGGFKLVTAGSTISSLYGLTSVTSFDNTKIPPNTWVWVKTPTVTTKPTYFTLTLIGYKKRV